MSFQTALFLPADLNTLITVFEKKVPLCFFKERHSSKRCQGVLFLPSATRCNVEISTKSGWKCHLYWDWGKRQIMQTARWEEGFCPPRLLVFGGKYPHVLFMGNENSLKVNYGGLGKKKKPGIICSEFLGVLNKSPVVLATAEARSFGKHLIFMLSVIRREKSCFADEMGLIMKSRSRFLCVSISLTFPKRQRGVWKT